ncbi:MAG: cupin domain-containing protein [bacterium]|nr:cupin domain-containing protein [bacterium]
MSRMTIPEFLKANPEIDLPLPGVTGWLLQGERQQAVVVEFNETVEVAEHDHADQWEIALSGQVELHRAGGTEVYEAGENFHIPAGQPHGATVHAGYKALIFFDEPDRYQPKKG